jgi:hypothetical protein
MSISATALAAAILLCTGTAASAATKRQKTTFYRSSPRAHAIVPHSGYGREMGFLVMRELTQEKSVWVNVR